MKLPGTERFRQGRRANCFAMATSQRNLEVRTPMTPMTTEVELYSPYFSSADSDNEFLQSVDDEEAIVDDRASLRPTEEVQRKLLGLLPSAPVPVSCLHTRRDTRR